MMAYENQNTASGSTIATKQRLAMGASAPKQDSAQPTQSEAIFKKQSLGQLSFKKKPKPPEDNISPSSPQVASATSSTGGWGWGAPAAPDDSRLAGIRRIVDSPAPMSPNDDNWGREATPPLRQLDRGRDPRLNALRRQSTAGSVQNKRSTIMDDAEKFLSNIMPPE